MSGSRPTCVFLLWMGAALLASPGLSWAQLPIVTITATDDTAAEGREHRHLYLQPQR